MSYFWHEFVVKNQKDYAEIIQNDLYNYCNRYNCYSFKFHGSVEFELKNGIRLVIEKKSNNPDNTHIGEIKIYLRENNDNWDIVIVEDKRSTIVSKSFSETFLSDLEIEVFFKK